MGFEIERKFLVRGDDWQPLATDQIHIRQGYLAGEGRASIRVRIRREKGATLTIKSREAQLRRLEFEYSVPTLEAEALLQLCPHPSIEKVRHIVPVGGHTWEVDVFAGDNHGLIIAEVELKHEHERIEFPSWVGTEVTGQRQYYNSALVQHPYRSWPNQTTVKGARQSP
jgi:adenylate cyclase